MGFGVESVPENTALGRNVWSAKLRGDL